MGATNQLSSQLPVAVRRQRHVEDDSQLEAPVASWEQAHRRVDRDFTSLKSAAASNPGQGALEARRVADREELLRVRSAAGPAHLLGDAKIHLELAIRRTTVAVTSTCDVRACRVQDLCHCASPLWTVA